jgi:MFS family permease
MVAALFFIVFVFWGTYYSFGVFFKPLSQGFGWSRAETSGAFTLGMIMQGLSGVAAGAMVDKRGPRVVMTVACLLTGLGFMLMSQTSTLWHLYLFFGILAGSGAGAAYIAPVATVPRWFTRRRGLALGIMLAAMGAGQMAMPPLFADLITRYGWQPSYVVAGAAVIAIGLPAALLLRRSPLVEHLPDTAEVGATAAKQQTWSTREALRSLQFWLLSVIWLLAAFSLQMVMVHIVPFATDEGIPLDTAARLLTLYGGMVIISRIGVGWISDLLGNRASYLGCLFLQMGALIILSGAGDLWRFRVAAVIFAAGYGGGASVFPKIVADVFGLRAIGAILGLVGLGWALGAGLGPFLAGLIFDLSGRYFAAFLTGAAVLALALALVLILFRVTRPQPESLRLA